MQRNERTLAKGGSERYEACIDAVAGAGRLSALEFKRRYMDVNSVQYPLVVHIGAHGMDSRGNYKALQVTPWEFHLLARRSKERLDQNKNETRNLK